MSDRTVDDVLREVTIQGPPIAQFPNAHLDDMRLLLTEIDALRAAVRPFAEAAKMLEGDEISDTKVWELTTPFNITCGHLLDAAAVIARAREAGP